MSCDCCEGMFCPVCGQLFGENEPSTVKSLQTERGETISEIELLRKLQKAKIQFNRTYQLIEMNGECVITDCISVISNLIKEKRERENMVCAKCNMLNDKFAKKGERYEDGTLAYYCHKTHGSTLLTDFCSYFKPKKTRS